MKKIKSFFALIMALVFVLNLCACGGNENKNPVRKTVKEEVIVPSTKIEKRLIGQRIVGENKKYSDGGNDSKESSDDEEDLTTEEETVLPLTDNLIEQGYFAYRIIRSNDSLNTVSLTTSSLVKTIKSKLNCTVQYKTDSVKENANQRELIICNSNRAASLTAEKALRENRANCYFDAIICSVGKDLCIFAYDSDSLNIAIEKFLAEFCSGKMKKIPANYKWIYKSDKKLKTISLGSNSIYKFDIVIPAKASSIALGAANILQETVEQQAGYPIDIVYDDKTKQTNEILVGNTNRSVQANDGEYKISLTDGKLHLVSSSDDGLFNVIRDFTEKIKSANSEYSVVANYSKTGTNDSVRKKWGDYSLVWYDEFSGNELDLSSWKAAIGTSASYNGGMIRHVSDEKNIHVSDGYLHCVGYQENVKDFSVGEIASKVYMRYGYIEAKYKQAPGSSYAAWWLNSDVGVGGTGAWRPEIDIVETFGSAKKIASNLHTWSNIGGGVGYHVDHGGVFDTSANPINREWATPGESLLSDEFHIYGCEWTPKFINFYIDGVLYSHWDITSSDFDAFRNFPTFFRIGHTIGKYGSASVNPADMQVDWVRIYQMDDSVSGYQSFVSNGKKPGEEGYVNKKK